MEDNIGLFAGGEARELVARMTARTRATSCMRLSYVVQRPAERHHQSTVSLRPIPMSSKIRDFLVETTGVIGNLVDAILTLFTGVVWLVITAVIGGVTLWFSWLLLFGG